MGTTIYKLVTRLGNAPFSSGALPIEESSVDPDLTTYDYPNAKEALMVIALGLAKQQLDVRWKDFDRECFSYPLYDWKSGQTEWYTVGIESY